MNETFRRSEKKYLLTMEQYEKLQDLLNHVDRFLGVLSTGMANGEQATALQNALTELQDIVSNLE